jgi:hypothetical protein
VEIPKAVAQQLIQNINAMQPYVPPLIFDRVLASPGAAILCAIANAEEKKCPTPASE